MSTNPSIVIIPGACSGPELYTTLGLLLERQGYEVFIGTLQTASRTPPEKAATMKEDAAYFRGIIEFVVGRGKEVVVVGHSYGGIVATECVKDLAKAQREAQGKPGGVVRVIYLASVIGDVGQGALEAMGGQMGPFIRFLGDYMHLDGQNAAPVLYNDLPDEEALRWGRINHCHSAIAMFDPLTFAAAKHVPVTYIQTRRDSVLVPEYQKACVEKLKKQNASNVSTVSIDTGHMPSVSAPDVTAKAIIDAISAT